MIRARLADPKDPADNEKILRFYESTALSGSQIVLRSVRGPDFFRFLRDQADQFSVFIGENDANEIVGVGTICRRPGYLRGEMRDVAYLGDLRIGFSRELIRFWRNWYANFLLETGLPTITAVIDQNTLAQRALVDQTSAPFRYELLSRYRMINILRALPWARGGAGMRVEPVVESERARLIEFLDADSRGRAFGYAFVGGEFARRLARWHGFSLERFLVAKSAAGEWLAVTALWNPEQSKSNILEKIPPWFQLYRPFISVPATGEKLRALYLTHLSFAPYLAENLRSDAVAALISHAFRTRSNRDHHLISLCDFAKWDLNSRLSLARGWVTQTIPMALYSVRHTSHAPLGLSANECAAPGFEIALV